MFNIRYSRLKSFQAIEDKQDKNCQEVRINLKHPGKMKVENFMNVG